VQKATNNGTDGSPNTDGDGHWNPDELKAA